MDATVVYELKRWDVISISKHLAVFMSGDAYGNPKFTEGEFIYTSAVQTVELLDDRLRVHTKNSIYDCYYDSYNGEARDFTEVPYFPLSEEQMEKGRTLMKIIEEAIQTSFEKDRMDLTKTVVEEEDYLVLEFSSEERYYYKAMLAKIDGEEYYSKYYSVHTGMFQDSVLIRDYDQPAFEGIDYRFFPYESDSLKFYRFPEFKGNVYIKNSGKKALEVETSVGIYMIPSQKCYRIAEDAEEGRRECRVAFPIDKSNVWEYSVLDNDMIVYTQPKNIKTDGEKECKDNEHYIER